MNQTELRQCLDSYLAIKDALGLKTQPTRILLDDFLRFVESRGTPNLSAPKRRLIGTVACRLLVGQAVRSNASVWSEGFFHFCARSSLNRRSRITSC